MASFDGLSLSDPRLSDQEWDQLRFDMEQQRQFEEARMIDPYRQHPAYPPIPPGGAPYVMPPDPVGALALSQYDQPSGPFATNQYDQLAGPTPLPTSQYSQAAGPYRTNPSAQGQRPYSHEAFDLSSGPPSPEGGSSLPFFSALEAFGAGIQGRMPLGVQVGMLNQQLATRRQAIAQQQQQLEERKRQHDLGLLEKAMSNPRAPMLLKQLGEDPNFRMAPQAAMLGRALKDTDYNSLKAYQEFIPPDVTAKLLNNTLPYEELTGWLDQARESAKVNAKEAAKATLLKQAENTPPAQRTPYQAQLVEEKQAALDLKKADTELKKAQTQKALSEAEHGPKDTTTLGRIHRAISGGKTFEEGTPDTQDKALKQYAQHFAEGRRDVMMDTTLGEHAQLWRDKKTGKALAPTVTRREAEASGAVSIRPDQVETINQLDTVDDALRFIENSADVLFRKYAKSPLAQAGGALKQKAFMKYLDATGDPLVSQLKSEITRITVPLIKLQGDTANVAVAEREMFGSSILHDTDTVEGVLGKIRSIRRAVSRTKGSMGFDVEKPVPIGELTNDEWNFATTMQQQGKSRMEVEELIRERRAKKGR